MCDLDWWNDVWGKSNAGHRRLHLRQLPAATFLPTHPRENAKTRYEIPTAQGKKTDLWRSICDRKCRKITRSKGNLAARCTHRDNLESSRQWVSTFVYTHIMITHVSRPFDQSQNFRGQLRRSLGKSAVERPN